MTQGTLFTATPDTPALRKSRGMAKVAKRHSNELERLRQKARELAQLRDITSDDVRLWADSVGIRMHPNAWGSLFRGNEWTHVGWKKSQILTNNCREIKVWRLR